MTPPSVCGACAHLPFGYRSRAGHLRLTPTDGTVLEPHLPIRIATEATINVGNLKPLYRAYAYWRDNLAPVGSDTSNVSAEEAAAKLGRWLARWGTRIDRELARVYGEQAPASR